MNNKVDIYHKHATCGGQLVMHHIKRKIIKKRSKNGQIIRQFKREEEFHECQECGAIVHCILFPSYDQLVVSHKIDVSFEEFKRVKKKLGLWTEYKPKRN